MLWYQFTTNEKKNMENNNNTKEIRRTILLLISVSLYSTCSKLSVDIHFSLSFYILCVFHTQLLCAQAKTTEHWNQTRIKKTHTHSSDKTNKTKKNYQNKQKIHLYNNFIGTNSTTINKRRFSSNDSRTFFKWRPVRIYVWKTWTWTIGDGDGQKRCSRYANVATSTDRIGQSHWNNNKINIHWNRYDSSHRQSFGRSFD